LHEAIPNHKNIIKRVKATPNGGEHCLEWSDRAGDWKEWDKMGIWEWWEKRKMRKLV
jgi:hypothetical protein